MNRKPDRMPKTTNRVMTRIKQAVLENRDKVFQEIRETKELYELMLKWSKGVELSPAEKQAVKAQIFDICKTIPALAVFMVPFGSILLVVLIKYLPFNILPTAFGDEQDLP